MRIQKHTKLNNSSLAQKVSELQRNVILRIILLFFVVVLILVIIFAQTVAWQTNVVHTGGLMFSADTWDFNAQIKVTGEKTLASPGDNGVLDIQITNESSDLAVASVRALKEQLIDKMRYRMFFYVDVSTVQNGENVDVIYINSINSYTYTVFPHQVLMLSNDANQQPLIKWEWTYDNLGYYVYGKKTDTDKIEVIEYLRPIQYDFDYMRTTFDSNGRLETVDGVISAQDFLLSFSQKDGYQGQIDVNTATSDGYYPVTFNSKTGYGVFAYLCTIDQINEGTLYDSELGNGDSEIGQATIQFTGQNCKGDGNIVYDEQSLITAINTPGLNVLTLNQDITLTQPISVNGGSQAVIDLAGNKIISTAETTVNVKDGASLILNNGEIVGNGGTGVSSISSYVTLNNVTISEVKEGVGIYDQKSTTGDDSVVHLNNCNINATHYGVFGYGNSSSEEETKIIIEDCTITGEQYAGVICNGTYYGSDISIKNSIVNGKYTAVYFPQKESTLTIENSNLEGYTGIAVKGGIVNIIDCTITGTGTYTPLPQDPSLLSNSGWWDTGDGVYLEANYSKWETKIFISGDKTNITGTEEGTLAVRKYPGDAWQASIEITGGTFNSDVTEFLKEGYQINSSNEAYKVTKK